jgi:Rha family phage regulatory protein
MTMTAAGANPIVFDRDGLAYANSRDVAAFFEKRHDNVLRDISNLLASLDSSNMRSGFFVEAALPDGQGIDRRAFEMTRDGFALLAMGFTGAQALTFKLRYIEQFNRMETELRRRSAVTEEVRQFTAAVADIKREMVEQVSTMLHADMSSIVHAELVQTVQQMVPEMITATLIGDPRVAAVAGITVREMLDKAKAMPKKRNGLNRRIGNRMRDEALSSGIMLHRCARTGTWLFPIGFANSWMEQHGDALVRDHNDKQMGQGVIRFPDRRRKPHAETSAPETP